MEILEFCSDELATGKKEKVEYCHLYTSKGQKIANMVDLPEDVDYLVVCRKEGFKNVRFREVQVDTNLQNQ